MGTKSDQPIADGLGTGTDLVGMGGNGNRPNAGWCEDGNKPEGIGGLRQILFPFHSLLCTLFSHEF